MMATNSKFKDNRFGATGFQAKESDTRPEITNSITTKDG